MVAELGDFVGFQSLVRSDNRQHLVAILFLTELAGFLEPLGALSIGTLQCSFVA